MKKSGDKRQAAIAFILITLFIDILGIGVIIPVLPELVKEFVGDSEEIMLPSLLQKFVSKGDSVAAVYVGVIASSYALMQFIFAPIVGAISDRFGRRPVLLASMFGLGIDFLIQGFAPNIWWLFVGRILAGVMGASFTTANAYIADVSTPETRARNFGLVGVMFGLGFIFGPAIGGILGSISLRTPFFVSAGLALLNWLYGFFILPESLPPEERNEKLMLSKANPFGSIRQLRAYPIVAGLAVAFVFMSLAQRGLENVWVLFTGARFGWDPKTNGLTLALVGFMAALVQGGCIRPFIKRFGERRTVAIGLVVSALAFLGYGLANRGWMMPIIIIFGSFGGVTGPAIQSIIAGAVPSSDQGKVQGALTSLVSLTNIFAPIIFTAGLFSYFNSEKAIFKLPGAPFLVGSVLLVLALFIVQRVFKKHAELAT